MKTLHGSGILTNIIDNNEVNTNATVQTKRMHKTKDNRKNKTNVSPSSYIKNKMICNIKENMNLGISWSCGSAPSQEIE